MGWKKNFSTFFILLILLIGTLCNAGSEDSAEALYQDAMQSSYYRGDYQKALIGLGKVCKQFPESHPAEHARYVITCILKYKLTLQECHLLKLSSRSIDGIDSRFLQTVLCLRLGERESTLHGFRQLFMELMTNPWAQEARDIFDSVVWEQGILEKEPIQSARMYLALLEYTCQRDNFLAESYFQKIIPFCSQEGTEAIEIAAYEKMIELFPERENDYIRSLTRLYQEIGDYEKGIAVTKKLLTLAENTAEIHNVMSILTSIYKEQRRLPQEILKSKKRLNKLEKELLSQKVIGEQEKEELLRKIYIACVELGFLQEINKNYGSAIEAYERAFELRSKDITICYALISLYRDRDLYDKKLAMYQYMWNNLRAKMGDYTKGDYVHCLASYENEPILALRIAKGLSKKYQQRYLGYIYKVWGEPELSSERFFLKDQEHPQKAAALHRELAQIFLEEEMFRELLCEYKKIFVLNPNEETFSQLTSLLLRAGFYKEANKWLQYAMQFVPELKQAELPAKESLKVNQPLRLDVLSGRLLWEGCVFKGTPSGSTLSLVGDIAYCPATIPTDRFLAVSAYTGEIYRTFTPPLPKSGKNSWWELKLRGIEADEDVVIFRTQRFRRTGTQGCATGHCYYVVDGVSGDTLWQSPPDVQSQYILENGDIYSYGRKQFCLHDKKTGKIKWEIKQDVSGRPYAYLDYVYIYDNQSQKLLKIDRKTGQVIKEYEFEGLLDTDDKSLEWQLVKVWGENIIVFVNNKGVGELLAFDIVENKKLWRHTGGTNIISRDKMLFGADRDGNVFCLHIPSGKVRWKSNLGAGEKMLVCDDKYLYVTAGNLWLTALSLKRGKYIWSFPIKSHNPVAVNNNLILCSGGGELGSERSYTGIYILNRDVLDSRGQNRSQRLIRLAQKLAKKGRSDLALEVYYLITDIIDPGCTDAYTGLSKLYEKIGNHEEAVKLAGVATKTLVPAQRIKPILKRQKKELLNICWQARTAPGLAMKPVSDGKRLYVAYNALKYAQIYAVSLANGRILWQQSINKPVASAMALSGRRLFVGEERGQVFYALSSKSGKILWTFSAPDGFQCPSYPVEADGVVYFTARAYNKGNFKAILYALNAKTGELLWQFSSQAPIVDTEWSDIRDYKVGLWKGMVFWGWNDGFLYAIDPEDGSLCWKYNAYRAELLKDWKKGEGGAASCPVVFKDKIFLASRNSHLCLLDAASGELIWQKPLRATNGTLFTVDGKLFARCDSGRYYCLAPETGTELWRTEPEFGGYSGCNTYQEWHLHEGRLYWPVGVRGYECLEHTTGSSRYFPGGTNQIWVDRKKRYLFNNNTITAYYKTPNTSNRKD